jgi:hypothetical protein
VVAPATLYCLPFVEPLPASRFLGKFGSKILHLSFHQGFLPGRVKTLDKESARALLERALSIDEATFGPNHPTVAIDVNNLGMVAKQHGDLESARALLERALRICEQKLGPDHPNTRIARGNLAGVLAAIAAQAHPPSFLARLRAALRRGRR